MNSRKKKKKRFKFYIFQTQQLLSTKLCITNFTQLKQTLGHIIGTKHTTFNNKNNIN